MGQKLVSVIIPTYNRAEYVGRAIESAQSQSYGCTQIIVVDDGSADGTAECVAAYSDVEYYFQENKGQAAARNLGLRYARGEYIASLDSDDRWDDEFLDVAVAAIERYEADFVFLNWLEISGDLEAASSWQLSGEWLRYCQNVDGEWSVLDWARTRDLFLRTCPAPSSALLIRRSSLVSHWNEKMRIADDWYLVLEMVVKSRCKSAFTMVPYWKKRVNANNLYHGRDHLEIINNVGLHDEVAMAHDFHEFLTLPERAIFRKRLAINKLNFGRLSVKRHGWSRDFLKSAAEGIKLAPISSSLYVITMCLYFIKRRLQILGQRLAGEKTNCENSPHPASKQAIKLDPETEHPHR
jgi:glycosyltransferase involved in cell wall biosynthesis